VSWWPRLLQVCGLVLASTGMSTAAVLSVKPGELTQALTVARDGDVLELQAGDYRGEVGVIKQKRLSLRGLNSDTGARAVLHADGKHAEGKAILVVRDGDVEIDNIEFRGARVPDRNGAGIRFERGRLRVQRCVFVDNENGILAGNIADAELIIEDSEFGQAPVGTPLPHLIYVGRIARFTLSGSRVWGGQQGHLVKSRARISHIRYNQLVDGVGGRAAYELEFPNGGLAYVVGNVIGQTGDTSNAVLVSFGAEGAGGTDDREHGLFMVNNTLISEGLRPGVFVRVADLKKPIASRFINNLSVGLGAGELGLIDPTMGNFIVPRQLLQSADTGGYGLPPDSMLRGRGVDPTPYVGRASVVDGVPQFEFTPPLGKKPITGSAAPSRWSPGAFQ
jgi:hypothetical protein